MMQATAPSAAERRAIEARIDSDGPVEALLSETTAVLSGLSACAGLVLVPRPGRRRCGSSGWCRCPTTARSR